MLSKKTDQLKRTIGRLESSDFILFIQYSDYNTPQWKSVRKELSLQNLDLTVIKTSKIKKYLETSPYAGLSPVFSGPMAFLSARKDVSLEVFQKGIKLLQKETKMQITGGVYYDNVLFPSKIKELVDLSSREELFIEGTCYLQAASGLNFVKLLDKGLITPLNTLNQGSQDFVSVIIQMEYSK